MTQGAIVVVSDAFDMTGTIDELVLIIANLVFITVAGLVAVFLTRRHLDAQRQLQIQAWHLRQLLPTAKRFQTRTTSMPKTPTPKPEP